MTRNRKSGYGIGSPTQNWSPAAFKSPGRQFTGNILNFDYEIGQIVYQELTNQWIIYRGNGIWDVFAGGASTDLLSLTGDDGVIVSPTSGGTIDVFGQVVSNATNAKALYFKNTSANTLTAQIQVGGGSTSSNIAIAGVISANTLTSSIDSSGFMSPFQYAKWVVNPTPGLGTQTTITAAVAAASAGDIIFVYQGTYTENFTAKAGVTITAWDDANGNGNVTILGKVTYTDSGIAAFSCITFQTNGDYAFEATGANQNNIYFDNCSFVGSDHTILNWTNTSATPGSNIFCYNSSFQITATGITYFNMDAGSMGSATEFTLYDCYFYNTAGSITPSTISGGSPLFYHCEFDMPIVITDGGGIEGVGSTFSTGSTNQTILTHSGAGSTAFVNCFFTTGIAPAIVVNGSSFIPLVNCTVTSLDPTACISGTGGVNYSGICFGNFSAANQNITTTSQFAYNGGTLVPVLAFGGASTGITYTTQLAQYLRVDNICHFSIEIDLSSKGSSTGAATITGLPFPSRNPSSTEIVIVVASVTSPAATTYFFGNIATTASVISIFSGQAATGGVAALADTNFSNSTTIRIQGSYFI